MQGGALTATVLVLEGGAPGVPPLPPMASEGWHVGVGTGPALLDAQTLQLALDAIEEQPDSPEAMERRAALLLFARRYEEAVTAFLAPPGAATATDHPGFLAALGALAIHKPWFFDANATLIDRMEAKRLFEAHLRRHPDDAAVHLYLAALLSRVLGDAAAALPCFERAASLHPDWFMTWTFWANAFSVTGRRDQALRATMIAGRLRPNSPTPLVTRFAVLLEAGEYDEALATLRRLLDVGSVSMSAFNNLLYFFYDPEMSGIQVSGVRNRVLELLAPFLEAAESPTPAVADLLIAGVGYIHLCDYDRGVALLRDASARDAGTAACLAEAGFDLADETLEGEATDTLSVFVDPRCTFNSYNTLELLYMAEIMRRRRGLAGMQVVYLWPTDPPRMGEPFNGRRTDLNIQFHLDESEWRLRNLLIPFASLFPSCVGVTLCNSYAQAKRLRQAAGRNCYPDNYYVSAPRLLPCYNKHLIMEQKARAEGFPSVTAPGRAQGFIRHWLGDDARRVVSITLRRTVIDSVRNSRLDQWIAFARSLDPAVWRPIFVRDTYDLFDGATKLPADLECFDAASLNIELRTALYEASDVNLFVAGGPAAIAAFHSHAPYLIYNQGKTGLNNQAAWLERFQGIRPGTDYLQAAPFQKLVWDNDELAVIRHHFFQLVAEMDAQKRVLTSTSASSSC